MGFCTPRVAPLVSAGTLGLHQIATTVFCLAIHLRIGECSAKDHFRRASSASARYGLRFKSRSVLAAENQGSGAGDGGHIRGPRSAAAATGETPGSAAHRVAGTRRIWQDHGPGGRRPPAGDSQLVGELIERFGVFQLWLREGVARLISAGRFLNPEITALYPRLALLQCIILRLSSKFDEANALCEAVARKTDGFTRDREGGDADALAVDWLFTEGVLVGGADRLPPDDLESRLPSTPSAADDDMRARTAARARHTMLCFVYYERARFEECQRHGLQAQAHFAEGVRFGDVFVNICLGMSAMAQGRVQKLRTRTVEPDRAPGGSLRPIRA